MKKSWKSTASKENLYKRSVIISKIRNFFLQNNVLEVDTPILTRYTTTDLNLFPFKIYPERHDDNNVENMWLITSPEYHMKRLLASGLGSIYQICHAFRSEEIGNYHNPEFSILEWYQPFYNMFDMIDAVNFFLQDILQTKCFDIISYQDIFIKYCFIDPLNTNIYELQCILKKLHHAHLIHINSTINDLLELIFMLSIEPIIGKKCPIFVYHYPAEQALLARLNQNDDRISDRFEVFFQGLELGNGFYELIDSVEQRKRFDQDNLMRINGGLQKRVIDVHLLNALSSGIPPCSGVAIGLDRIIMLALKVHNINDVLSFNFKNC